jgi:hypothetical protein
MKTKKKTVKKRVARKSTKTGVAKPVINRGKTVLSAINKLESERKKVKSKDLLRLYDVQINLLHDKFDNIVKQKSK